MQDFLYILPNAREYPADVIHHVCGLVLCFFVLRTPQTLAPYIFSIMRLEATTVLLNLMWFLREFSLEDRFAVLSRQVLPKSFALLYLLIRVLWYPRFVHTIMMEDKSVCTDLGRPGQAFLITTVVLNLFWFTLILKKVVGA